MRGQEGVENDEILSRQVSSLKHLQVVMDFVVSEKGNFAGSTIQACIVSFIAWTLEGG